MCRLCAAHTGENDNFQSFQAVARFAYEFHFGRAEALEIAAQNLNLKSLLLSRFFIAFPLCITDNPVHLP